MGEASALHSSASAGLPICAVVGAGAIKRETSVSLEVSESAGDPNRLAHVGSIFYLKARELIQTSEKR